MLVAAGIKAEMNSKLDRMEDSEDEAIKPPKNKARLEGKENKVSPKPKLSKRRQNKKEPGRYYVILRAQCVCGMWCVRSCVCVMWCMCWCVCADIDPARMRKG